MGGGSPSAMRAPDNPKQAEANPQASPACIKKQDLQQSSEPQPSDMTQTCPSPLANNQRSLIWRQLKTRYESLLASFDSPATFTQRRKEYLLSLYSSGQFQFETPTTNKENKDDDDDLVECLGGLVLDDLYSPVWVYVGLWRFVDAHERCRVWIDRMGDLGRAGRSLVWPAWAEALRYSKCSRNTVFQMIAEGFLVGEHFSETTPVSQIQNFQISDWERSLSLNTYTSKLKPFAQIQRVDFECLLVERLAIAIQLCETASPDFEISEQSQDLSQSMYLTSKPIVTDTPDQNLPNPHEFRSSNRIYTSGFVDFSEKQTIKSEYLLLFPKTSTSRHVLSLLRGTVGEFTGGKRRFGMHGFDVVALFGGLGFGDGLQGGGAGWEMGSLVNQTDPVSAGNKWHLYASPLLFRYSPDYKIQTPLTSPLPRSEEVCFVLQLKYAIRCFLVLHPMQLKVEMIPTISKHTPGSDKSFTESVWEHSLSEWKTFSLLFRADKFDSSSSKHADKQKISKVSLVAQDQHTSKIKVIAEYAIVDQEYIGPGYQMWLSKAIQANLVQQTLPPDLVSIPSAKNFYTSVAWTVLLASFYNTPVNSQTRRTVDTVLTPNVEMWLLPDKCVVTVYKDLCRPVFEQNKWGAKTPDDLKEMESRCKRKVSQTKGSKLCWFCQLFAAVQVVKWVSCNISYDYVGQLSAEESQTPSKVLETGLASCRGLSHLVLSILRTIGIYSELVDGHLDLPPQATNKKGLAVVASNREQQIPELSSTTWSASHGKSILLNEHVNHQWNKIFVGEFAFQSDPTLSSYYVRLGTASGNKIAGLYSMCPCSSTLPSLSAECVLFPSLPRLSVTSVFVCDGMAARWMKIKAHCSVWGKDRTGVHIAVVLVMEGMEGIRAVEGVAKEVKGTGRGYFTGKGRSIKVNLENLPETNSEKELTPIKAAICNTTNEETKFTFGGMVRDPRKKRAWRLTTKVDFEGGDFLDGKRIGTLFNILFSEGSQFEDVLLLLL